jgi:lysozyme
MNRTLVASLTLSASALVGLAVHEGYRDTAYVPVKGDRPTLGFGDAQGVRLGDRTDPVRALIRLNFQADVFQQEMRRCIGDVPMYQYEWDAVISWAFNIGSKAACGSTLVRKLQALDYPGACKELLRWDRFQGSVLPGLTKRRQDEYQKCMGDK